MRIENRYAAAALAAFILAQAPAPAHGEAERIPGETVKQIMAAQVIHPGNARAGDKPVADLDGPYALETMKQYRKLDRGFGGKDALGALQGIVGVTSIDMGK